MAYSSFTFPSSAGTGFSSLTTSVGLLAGWGFTVPPSAPAVTNSTGATNLGSYTARLNGEITDNGREDPAVHIYWGDNDAGDTPASWDHNIDLGIKPVGTFYTDISGLTASTPYYYRCYASNSGGGSWAASAATFTTLPPPSAPTVTNASGATVITNTAARLNGEVTSTGGENPVVHVYWGPTDGGTTPGSWAHDVNLGAKGTGSFYTDISGLSASTTYFYRCYAKNSAVDGDWADSSSSFTTPAIPVKLIGVDASTPSSAAYPGSYFFLYRFQAAETGNIVTFKIKASGPGNVKAAIYADNAGEPGSLLNAVNTDSPVVTGWNDITITSTPVVSGNYYWLSYVSDSAIGCYQSATGTLRYKANMTYSSFTFPSSAGTGFSSLTTSIGLLAGWGFTVPPVPPSTPAMVSPGASVIFKWAASSGATKYYLQVSTDSSFTGTNLFDSEVGDITTQEVTGLALGTTCYWRIKAGNAGGWSSWSSIRSVITDELP
jgi:hypothetical protein